jgi:hypothetical protein
MNLMIFFFRNLLSLSLSSINELSVEGFGLLFSHCPNLNTLNLSHCWMSVDNELLTVVASHCQRLEELVLTECSKVSDEGIIELVKYCKKLKRLNLLSTSITSIGLEYILQNGWFVQVVYVGGTKISVSEFDKQHPYWMHKIVQI